MSKRKSNTIYVVVRKTWNGFGSRYGGMPNSEERVPVRAYSTKAAAKAGRKDLEAEDRRHFDPYTLFSGEWQEGVMDKLLARMKELNLPAPSHENGERNFWTNAPTLTEDQRLSLWNAVPELEIYEVIEKTLED